MTKEQRIERADRAVSVLIRLLVSALLPLWGLGMLALGIFWGSWWWIACGVVTGAVGLLMLVGSPIAAPFLRCD